MAGLVTILKDQQDFFLEMELRRRAELEAVRESFVPRVAPVLGQSVTEWLAKVKLAPYAVAMAAEGYDELQFFNDADEADIDALIATLQSGTAGMKKPHAKTLKKAWKALTQ